MPYLPCASRGVCRARHIGENRNRPPIARTVATNGCRDQHWASNVCSGVRPYHCRPSDRRSAKGRYNVYDDAIDRERGLLFYSWAQGPLNAGDNRKLHVAFEQRAPIILFEKPLPNLYAPVFPVSVIDVLPDRRQFVIDLDESGVRATPATTLDKRYVERLVRTRVHQPVFRARVLSAYNKRCAVCTLRYAELLDAAHILPDTDERSLPVVTNGMAMCTIHHAAYDQNFLGVSPDYVVHINERLLADRDGPMLQYGLQAMDGKALELPTSRADRPDREYLAERFAGFGL